ncbi:(R)-mandelonitrile lyase-like protein [Tanacetum coccineum]
MQDCKPISTPFPTDVKLSSKMSPSSEKERMEMSRVPYASAVGSLMFAMICTRLDIAHAVGVVSRYMAEPGREPWEAVKRILRYIKGISYVALCFGDSDLIVTGYVDSDYAGDLDISKSTTGYVFTLSGGTVSWVSKLQSVVAMSTTEAEYVAAAESSKEAVWLKMLLEEIGHKQEKITLFCDNQSALYLARNPAFHSKKKYIRVQYHFVREKVEEGTVDMQKIHTDDNESYNYNLECNLPNNLDYAKVMDDVKSQDASYLSFTYEAKDFNPSPEYDYIIVGGGTAGCPLAATLSEHYSVLLLERGGVPDSDPNVFYEINSLTNVININEKSSPAQAFTSEDGIENARGNVLGGGSMINFGIYSRADDYFYQRSGIEWDMRSVEKAYEWVEDSVVSVPERLNTWQNSNLYALLEAGLIPSNGFSVEHLLGLAADGVIYHDSLGKHHEIHIRRNGEVIICAGAIGSPQLLLINGVGHGSYQESQTITIVRQHPDVGQFMVDNPRSVLSLLVPFPLDDIGARVVGITDGFYIESLSGVTPFNSPANSVLFPDVYPPLNLSVMTIASKFSIPLSNCFISLISPNDITVAPKFIVNNILSFSWWLLGQQGC